MHNHLRDRHNQWIVMQTPKTVIIPALPRVRQLGLGRDKNSLVQNFGRTSANVPFMHNRLMAKHKH
jgi:hypothetical protein